MREARELAEVDFCLTADLRYDPTWPMSDLDSLTLAAPVRDFAELRTSVAQLREENGALRRENTELREALLRETQRAEVAEERVRVLAAERAEQADVMASMNAELETLRRRVFGRQSEKMPPMSRELKARSKNADADAAEAARKRKENRDTRRTLETTRVEHKVKRSGKACPKCGTTASEFKTVGEGTQTVVFEYTPGRFVRQIHFQETLACPCGEHLVTAEGPKRVVNGGTYGPGFIANVLVGKGCDSIPLYRMEKQFERLGIPVARSTMARLFHLAIEQNLHPIAERILQLIRQSDLVLADETPMRMQRKPDTGKAGKGYVWTFIAENLVGYRFSASRSGETPLRLLGGTSGTLVVDAYTGYNKTCSPASRTRAGCLAHVRRKFFDALKSAPEAQVALSLILELYLVEHDAQEAGIVRTPAHLALREKRSAPIMGRFHEWLSGQQGRHLPKGAMGKAISYALENWTALTQFLNSEQLPLDNNRSEAALRVVALLRKNSLFVGEEEHGENLADLLTILATCAANDVNPLQYLTDILPRVQDHPNRRLDELLPQNWKPVPDQETS